MRRYAEDTTRKSTHKGRVYEFSRNTDYYDDRTHVEVTARVWTGYVWRVLHRWTSEVDK